MTSASLRPLNSNVMFLVVMNKIITIITIIAIVLLVTACTEKPSETELLSNYQQHKEVMNKLLSKYPSCVTEGKPTVWLSNNSEKAANCHSLLRKSNLRGISVNVNGDYTLYYSGNSYVSHQVDYFYSQKDPEPLFSSVAEAASSVNPYERGHIKIEGAWYLVYVCNCG